LSNTWKEIAIQVIVSILTFKNNIYFSRLLKCPFYVQTVKFSYFAARGGLPQVVANKFIHKFGGYP
jgi:hypothetical protein